jgi:mannose-6-phosphate isomerase
MKLTTHSVQKPWGRADLPPPFTGLSVGGGDPIGEIWFDAGADKHQELLVKYIFTSEKLSVQVHPTDDQGRARGLAGGKSECWYILDVQPGATLGLGTLRDLDGDALRAAALDGSIEALMDWKTVAPGDFYFVPAGTVHAIGAGISLIEIQQNVDVTYRLYDYGRPRELHLDDGVAVSVAAPYTMGLARRVDACRADAPQVLLTECPQFTVMHSCDLAATRDAFAGHEMWVVPLDGVTRSGGEEARAGECLWVSGTEAVTGDAGTHALVGIAPFRV